MFIVESAAVVAFALLLFLQLFSPWWALGTVLVIVARAVAYSYLASDRVVHLRGLVFFTCLVFLLCAEIMVTFGLSVL
jgi:hypothetical protein